MAGISGLLVTVRTGKQGAEMMRGKMNPEYLEEITTLRINPADMAEASLTKGQKARIISPYGEAIVTCQDSDLPKKIFILPLGPVANLLVCGADTDGTGIPAWKGQQVTIEPFDKV
jgi:formylmethanofuran dehydrogenase subunit D